ncbi:ParB/RepB/Spo0J family partition protein [bacterium]|nr:MAG: ParB/RepB/Spo0J family partition protein [bacterium]
MIQQNLLQMVKIAHIGVPRHKLRRSLGRKSFKELVKSVKEYEILQPLILQCSEQSEKPYTIIMGERRFNAAISAGLNEIPACIKNVSSIDSLEMALTENIHRKDLSPIEEAEGYKFLLQLMIKQKGDVENISDQIKRLAQKIGKSVQHIKKRLGLLELSKDIQKAIGNGKISLSVANEIGELKEHKDQKMAEKIAVKNPKLSIRDLKKELAKSLGNAQTQFGESYSTRTNNRNLDDFIILVTTLCDSSKLQENWKKIEEHLTPESGPRLLNRIYETITNLMQLCLDAKQNGYTCGAVFEQMLMNKCKLILSQIRES